ncbi:ParB/Srx family N-terminal domain-containing protein [Escherichia coli]|uniref:ParB/Srx family N-terminal domain-containing protein n=1 Tax=Escherichia coli TaxID=562 RepID=UPI000AF3A946|nr:ParB/Srx family N-terminal domain-containing protein [Escherichia coli]MCT7424224.1 ParB/Srx family N-terminal domain-containing protein [Escherichia coli]MDT1246312.1 ParB/Srx family N-terminal domain-containing protein [Escherichia coli]
MSEKLKIVYRPLQELSPYAHNARTHSTEQVAQLVESIKQFGWTNPVLIDEKGEIIAGYGRVMAAEMLKMDSVPVIVLSGLTDEQKKAYRLADNRLPMNAGWDEDLLRMELSDLINADFDVSLTGFIPTEIDELLTDVLPGMCTTMVKKSASMHRWRQKKLQSLMARQKIIAWLKKLQRKNWLSLPLSKTRRRRLRHWKCCQKSTRKS